MPGIFLSHASDDRDVADALVGLLRLGSNVSRERIFYSSGAGTGVPVGTRFNEYIRSQVDTIGTRSPVRFETRARRQAAAAPWFEGQEPIALALSPPTSR